jgi:hypothetical protein
LRTDAALLLLTRIIAYVMAAPSSCLRNFVTHFNRFRAWDHGSVSSRGQLGVNGAVMMALMMSRL